MKLETPDIVSVKILHPVLKDLSNEEHLKNNRSELVESVVSIPCSLLAVIICYVSKRPVWIAGCHNDSKKDLTTIEFHLEPKRGDGIGEN